MGEVVKHAVHLVEVALLVMRLLGDLVAVGLADGAGLIGPLIPDVRVEVVDVVRLLLVDPEHLVHSGLQSRAPQRERGELLAQVVAVGDAEALDGVGRRAVLPVRANLLALGGGAVV